MIKIHLLLIANFQMKRFEMDGCINHPSNFKVPRGGLILKGENSQVTSLKIRQFRLDDEFLLGT